MYLSYIPEEMPDKQSVLTACTRFLFEAKQRKDIHEAEKFHNDHALIVTLSAGDFDEPFDVFTVNDENEIFSKTTMRWVAYQALLEESAFTELEEVQYMQELTAVYTVLTMRYNKIIALTPNPFPLKITLSTAAVEPV